MDESACTMVLSFQLTGNNIGDKGTTSLSEALKLNSSLTKLDLGRENKRKTHNGYLSVHHFSTIHNRQETALGKEEQRRWVNH